MRWIRGVPTSVDDRARFDSALRLRGDVYVHERGFLKHDRLDSAGRESDHLDSECHHLIVTSAESVVGNARLIPRNGSPLPYESLFALPPPSSTTAEASRFISRASDRRTNGLIVGALVLGVTQMAVHLQVESVYAVVEPFLHRYFVSIGLPTRVESPLRTLSEYSSDNLCIAFDVDAAMDGVSCASPELITAVRTNVADDGQFFR